MTPRSRQSIQRLTPIRGALLFTVISVTGSVAMCFPMYALWLHRSFSEPLAMMLPILVPALITPPISYYLFYYGDSLLNTQYLVC